MPPVSQKLCRQYHKATFQFCDGRRHSQGRLSLRPLSFRECRLCALRDGLRDAGLFPKLALRDLLRRRTTSVAKGPQRKSTGRRLSQRTTLMTPTGHQRTSHFTVAKLVSALLADKMLLPDHEGDP
jgi:hypothetical protein